VGETGCGHEAIPPDEDLVNRELMRSIHEPKLLHAPHPHEYAEDAFRKLQEDVRTFLRALVGRRDQILGAVWSIGIDVHVTILVVPRMDGEPERRMIAPRDTTRDVFLWILLDSCDVGWSQTLI
jgi:hypothetical protein